MKNRTVGRRMTARIATIALGAALPVMTVAAPALALHHDDGSGPGGPSLGVGLTIFYFFVIPVGAFLVIAGLSLLPSALNAPRYRPGKEWVQGEEWFGEPAAGDETDSPKDTGRGGASAEW